MKIVVTGALGHIGSRLIRALPAAFPSAGIWLLDNLMTQRYASLFDLPRGAAYRFVEADVRDYPLADLLASDDVVIHLAAITDAAASFERADEVEENNLAATAAAAAACAASGARLIALSSTSVYGTQEDVIDEDCSPDELAPQSPYAESKIKEENLVRGEVASAGLRAVICRCGTIFGTSPGMRFHTAVNKFCWQASMGLPITVWRTAYEQKRPYLDLDDAVRAFIHIINTDLFTGEVYNILTANLTVRDIVEIISERIPETEITFVDEAIMNQLSYEVLRNKFAATGFEFRGDVRAAIGQTLELLGR